MSLNSARSAMVRNVGLALRLRTYRCIAANRRSGPTGDMLRGFAAPILAAPKFRSLFCGAVNARR